MEKEKSVVLEPEKVFYELNKIDVSEHIEKKNGLSYVSWAWAWKILKEHYPLSQYKVYETENGCNYFTDGRTAWVKTGVIVEGLEHIEYLPIMDYRNNSIPLEKITSFDVNTAIQRSLTKAIGRHGLGLCVYAGEDLPEDRETSEKPQKADKVSKELKEQAQLFDVNLNKLAVYFKKPITELTDDDVLKGIEMKRQAKENK